MELSFYLFIFGECLYNWNDIGVGVAVAVVLAVGVDLFGNGNVFNLLSLAKIWFDANKIIVKYFLSIKKKQKKAQNNNKRNATLPF